MCRDETHLARISCGFLSFPPSISGFWPHGNFAEVTIFCSRGSGIAVFICLVYRAILAY